ncbi:17528_t:CDS:2 [Funneliformis geosporum]|nr:17528_t:CDS:2 [Funneliformis geosporum]
MLADRFPLSNDYEVITKWGKGKSNTVKYSIYYENSKLVFKIYYNDNFDQILETTQLCINRATQVQKILHPDNNSLISGTLLFGMQLQVLKTSREKRIKKLKPYENITEKTRNERAQHFAECTRSAFKDLSNYCYNPEDELTLNSMTFTVGIQKDSYQIDFGKVDKKEIKLKRAFTVKAIDQGQIS